MMNFFRKKIEHHRLKRTFREYGSVIVEFMLKRDGRVEYARWQHPFEKPKVISQVQVDFFRQFIRPGDLVIDIGAHTGDTTVPMALAAGKEGTVLGIEPNPYVYKILEENSRLNPDKTSIIPLNFAVTEKEGKFVFNYSDASFCNGGYLSRIHYRKHNHRYTLEVNGKNLETYLTSEFAGKLSRLSFIKVDAEGYDKDIIRSVKNLLLDHRPYLVTECYRRLDQAERKEFYDLIRELGYLPFHMDSFDNLARIQIRDASEMMKWRHFDMILIPQEKL
jgi:FkbM family methyltransferase